LSTGVDEAVQALAGVHVAAVGDDAQGVLRRQVGQPDPRAVEDLGRVECLPVELDLAHRRATRSMNVLAPGSVQRNRTTVVDGNVGSSRVRSSSTS
jgi:hypothetical protein